MLLMYNKRGGSFTDPSSLSDLQLWLDADDASTISDTSGAVDQWNDKSGNDYHVTQTGSNRPTTGANTLNDKNVITFDGVDDYLEKTNLALNSQCTMFIVSKVITAPPTEFYSLFSYNNATDRDFQFDGGDSVGTAFYGRFFSTNMGATSPPLGTEDTTGITSLHTIRLDSDSADLRIDSGAQTATDTYVDNLATPGHFKLTVNRSTTTPVYLNCDIAEVIIYNRALSDAEIALVETYLDYKWKEIPMAIGGCVCWLDASDTSTITTGATFTIADKSNNGNDGVQTTAGKQPTTGVATINSLNALQFDGTNDALSIASSTSIDDVFQDGATVFVMFKANALHDNGRILDKNNKYLFFFRSGDRMTYQQRTSSGTYEYRTATTSVGQITNGSTYLLDYSYKSSVPDSAPSITKDGVSMGSYIQSTGTTTPETDVASALTLFDRASGGRAVEIDMAAFFIFNKVLTTREKRLMRGYISEKWGEGDIPDGAMIVSGDTVTIDGITITI